MTYDFKLVFIHIWHPQAVTCPLVNLSKNKEKLKYICKLKTMLHVTTRYHVIAGLELMSME